MLSIVNLITEIARCLNILLALRAFQWVIRKAKAMLETLWP